MDHDDRWISARDWPPDADDLTPGGREADPIRTAYVLAYSGSAGVTMANYNLQSRQWNDADGFLEDVTHWMPAPPAPGPPPIRATGGPDDASGLPEAVWTERGTLVWQRGPGDAEVPIGRPSPRRSQGAAAAREHLIMSGAYGV
jgi:hypothetical protein